MAWAGRSDFFAGSRVALAGIFHHTRSLLRNWRKGGDSQVVEKAIVTANAQIDSERVQDDNVRVFPQPV